jgi:hypothetical protein
MLQSFHKTWTIVEEPRFAGELSALTHDPIRADEFMEGAKWMLAKKPEAGVKLTEDIWYLPMLLQNVTLYCRFDENSVYLLSIRSIRSVGDDSEGD